jgi:hypothetical protein
MKIFPSMNSNNLFSFLEEPEDDELHNGEEMEIDSSTKSLKSPRKRKADSPPANPSTSEPSNRHPGEEDHSNGTGPSAPKKLRMSSPKPMVLDDFETEAKREVAASAGLTGAAEAGSRLELRHQVSASNIWKHPSPMISTPGSTSSGGPSGLQLRPNIKTCPTSEAGPGIQVRT